MALSLFFSKLLPLFIYPLGLALGLLSFSVLTRFLSWPKTSVVSACMALVVLWLSSMPIVAERLARSLESQYPAVLFEDIPVADCVIVLGGVIGQKLQPRAEVNYHEAIDRVLMVSRLINSSKVSRVIIAAGNLPWSQDTRPEAQLIADFLLELGAQQNQLFLDTQSRNTHENAVNSARIYEELACGKTLLVTSAVHMKRAMAAFKKEGLTIVPVPVDVMVVSRNNEYTIFDWLPNVASLQLTTRAFKEVIGLWVYQLRSWA